MIIIVMMRMAINVAIVRNSDDNAGNSEDDGGRFNDALIKTTKDLLLELNFGSS